MNNFSTTLRITEIFYSLQGESTLVGLPTVFIRLTGCPLRCHYCDTAYAFHGGKRMPITEILHDVLSYQCNIVCVTGGEPLAQKGCYHLLTDLCDKGLRVSLETSGALPIAEVDKRVNIVMDLKTPDSGERDKNRLANLDHLKPTDELKFVIGSQEDYAWACNMMEKYQLTKRANVLFSPSYERINPTELANWIVRDRLSVRFQLQLHKLLWNDAPGH
jgi:7-carboxy-7-deazaguanine synthase